MDNSLLARNEGAYYISISSDQIVNERKSQAYPHEFITNHEVIPHSEKNLWLGNTPDAVTR